MTKPLTLAAVVKARIQLIEEQVIVKEYHWSCSQCSYKIWEYDSDLTLKKALAHLERHTAKELKTTPPTTAPKDTNTTPTTTTK